MTAAKNRKRGEGLWRPIALLVLIVAFLFIARAAGLGERIAQVRDWIPTLGMWGPIVYIVLYGLAVSVAIPGSALTVMAGAIFGSVWGVAIVTVGATFGATLSFLIARYVARDAIAARLSSQRHFQRLNALTETHGPIIVALTRLVPIFPYTALNFGFGLTRVRLGTYVFWSFLCMIPGTALYVVGADALTQGIAEGRVPWGLVAVFVGVIAIVAVLVRSARRRLHASEADAENADETPPSATPETEETI